MAARSPRSIRLRELDLLLPGEQRVAADLLEEQRHRVGRLLGEVVDHVRRLLDSVAPAVIADVDPARLEHVLERPGVVLAEVGLLHDLTQLRKLDAGVGARLAAGGELVREPPQSL